MIAKLNHHCNYFFFFLVKFPYTVIFPISCFFFQPHWFYEALVNYYFLESKGINNWNLLSVDLFDLGGEKKTEFCLNVKYLKHNLCNVHTEANAGNFPTWWLKMLLEQVSQAHGCDLPSLLCTLHPVPTARRVVVVMLCAISSLIPL